MARIRTVKPEFWTSEQVISCSPPARLLFIGLWNFCDDQGIHPIGYVRIKAEIFPGDNFSLDEIKQWVNELLAGNLIREYFVDHQGYWIVTGWKKHQKIDRPNPKHPLPESVLKKITDCSSNQSRTLVDYSSNDQRNLDGPSPPEGKGMERKGMDNKTCEAEASRSASFTDPVVVIFLYWKEVMKHPKARLDKKRRKQIEEALSQGYSVEDLKRAIDGCALTPFNMGENDRGQRFDMINIIFRSADQIDRFIDNAEKPPAANDTSTNSTPEWI